MTTVDLETFAEQHSAELEGAHPREILRWAADEFGEKFCITSSMGDAVLAHLASSVIPGVDVVFLDTGYHFPDTLATRDRVASELDVHVISVKPELTVAQQNIQFGQSLYSRDPDQCCAMRKVAPLNKILAGYTAWASGIRRDESATRANTPIVAIDRRGLMKISPLANWTQSDVDTYIAENDVIVNPLSDRGFASIGCAPCTRAVNVGEDARAGRWAGQEKTECGLHL